MPFIPVNFLHPQQQPQTRRAGTRIFVNHAPFLVTFDQLFQAFGRILQLVFIVDKRKVTVIKGNEGVVFPAARYVNGICRHAAFGEQSGLGGGFQQVVIQPEHHVGFAVFAFHAQAIQ